MNLMLEVSSNQYSTSELPMLSGILTQTIIVSFVTIKSVK